LYYGKNGGNSDVSRGVEYNGTVYVPFTVDLHDGNRYQTIVVRGIWDTTQKDYKWYFGEYITLTGNNLPRVHVIAIIASG
jgi:hypothetical protein